MPFLGGISSKLIYCWHWNSNLTFFTFEIRYFSELAHLSLKWRELCIHVSYKPVAFKASKTHWRRSSLFLRRNISHVYVLGLEVMMTRGSGGPKSASKWQHARVTHFKFTSTRKDLRTVRQEVGTQWPWRGLNMWKTMYSIKNKITYVLEAGQFIIIKCSLPVIISYYYYEGLLVWATIYICIYVELTLFYLVLSINCI